MSKMFPWMPSWIDDFNALAAQLDCEQLGAVLRLRHYAWDQEPPCTLPDDDRRLAAISGLGASWSEHATVIRGLLSPVEGERLVDSALLKRYRDQKVKHAEAVRKGKLGGRPRSGGVGQRSWRNATEALADDKQPDEQRAKPEESSAFSQLHSLSTLISKQQLRTEITEEAKPEESSAFRGDPKELLGDWRSTIDPIRASRERQNGNGADAH